MLFTLLCSFSLHRDPHQNDDFEKREVLNLGNDSGAGIGILFLEGVHLLCWFLDADFGNILGAGDGKWFPPDFNEC